MGQNISCARLGLGTAQWGMRYGIINRTGRPAGEQVGVMLACAREAGIHVLDTARAYGGAEDLIGELVGDDPYWTVVTKLSPEVGAGTPNRAANAGP